MKKIVVLFLICLMCYGCAEIGAKMSETAVSSIIDRSISKYTYSEELMRRKCYEIEDFLKFRKDHPNVRFYRRSLLGCPFYTEDCPKNSIENRKKEREKLMADRHIEESSFFSTVDYETYCYGLTKKYCDPNSNYFIRKEVGCQNLRKKYNLYPEYIPSPEELEYVTGLEPEPIKPQEKPFWGEQ